MCSSGGSSNAARSVANQAQQGRVTYRAGGQADPQAGGGNSTNSNSRTVFNSSNRGIGGDGARNTTLGMSGGESSGIGSSNQDYFRTLMNQQSRARRTLLGA